jgi:hypothetical protein
MYRGPVGLPFDDHLHCCLRSDMECTDAAGQSSITIAGGFSDDPNTTCGTSTNYRPASARQVSVCARLRCIEARLTIFLLCYHAMEMRVTDLCLRPVSISARQSSRINGAHTRGPLTAIPRITQCERFYNVWGALKGTSLQGSARRRDVDLPTTTTSLTVVEREYATIFAKSTGVLT